MELKQIITHSLGDYTKQLIDALNQGYSLSENIDHYPVQIAHMFYATLVKEDVSEQRTRAAKKPKVGEDAA